MFVSCDFLTSSWHEGYLFDAIKKSYLSPALCSAPIINGSIIIDPVTLLVAFWETSWKMNSTEIWNIPLTRENEGAFASQETWQAMYALLFLTALYRVFRAQADWTFILPSEPPAEELRHLPRKMPPRGTTDWYVWYACRWFLLGKCRSSFVGSSDGKMNVQSACPLNTRYVRIFILESNCVYRT
jgi:hypothetical protein